SANLSGAAVVIAANLHTADVLHFTNQNGISGVYTAATGTLQLTGTASVADYQAALRSVAYSNADTGASTAPRTVTFTVTDTEGHSQSASRDLLPVASLAADLIVWQGDVSTAWTDPNNWV